MAVNSFDADFYRAANPDLITAGLTTDAQLLSHFQNSGLDEGRAFSPFVDLNFYRSSSNSDLAAAGLNTNRQFYEHLQNSGVAEGRLFSPFVDINFYLTASPDLAQTFGGNREQAFEHLQNFGVAEGRLFSPFFNADYYLAYNPDLAQSLGNNRVQALQHFELNGLNEGRLFSVPFDINYYRSVNSDLAAAGLNNQQLYQHFQLNGLSEERASSPFFNVSYYLANNSDLSAAGFNSQQAYEHFVLFGSQEGRPSSDFTGNDYAGNTLDTARNIPVEGISTPFRDVVNSTDDDFYRLSISVTSDSNLLLNGLRANVNVEVSQDLNNNGVIDSEEVIASLNNQGTTAESLSNSLAAGTYYIRVYSVDGSDTSYNLTLSTTPITSPPPAPSENTLNTLDIGPLSGTLNFNDSVSSANTEDFYRFSLSTTSDSSLVLDGLSANADVNLIQDFNNNNIVEPDEVIASSSDAGNTAESLSNTLEAGIYYIRVNLEDGADTNYNLTLSATPIASPPSAPSENTLSTARDIGPLSGTLNFNDSVSSANPEDFYRFSLSTTSDSSLLLNGLSADADVDLIQDFNNNNIVEPDEVIASSNNEGDTAESLSGTIAAGTYYVRVSEFEGDTNYNLTLSATPV